MQASPFSQIDNLTGLRAFAAISVVLLHVRYGALADHYGPLAFVFQNSGLGVDVFFTLSGFIIGYVHHRDFIGEMTYRKYGAFLWKRIARMYPVHIFMLLVVAFALPQWGRYEWSEYDTWRSFWLNVLLVHSWGTMAGLSFNQVSWTISAEWFAYLIFPGVVFVTRGWPSVLMGGLLLAVLIALPGIEIRGPSDGLWAIKCLAYFVAGYSAVRLCTILPKDRGWDALWAVGATVMGPLIALAFGARWGYFDQAFPAMVVVLIACLYMAPPNFLYANPVAIYLGRISYSLYMTHVITIFVIRQPSHSTLPLALELAAILAVAALVYHLVELPCQTRLRGWFRKAHPVG